MKKNYEVVKDFWIGECNMQVRKNDVVSYDDVSGILTIDSKQYEAKNLKAAIKQSWLIPVDGKYPELDGPLGETEVEKLDRKRKERFTNQSTKQKEVKGLVKDERQVGLVSEDSDLFKSILNAEPVASVKVRSSKKVFDVVEDDTKEVGVAKFDNSETRAMKKALKQDVGEKVAVADFKVYDDQYDAESLQVGKYSVSSNEVSLTGWAKMHWTKKAEVINSSKDKTFLNQLKGLETSKKIKERIAEKLETL